MEKIIEGIQIDPLGLPFKIVAKKLKSHKKHISELDEENWLRKIIGNLFT